MQSAGLQQLFTGLIVAYPAVEVNIFVLYLWIKIGIGGGNVEKSRLYIRNAVILALVNILLRGAAVSFNGYVAGKIGAESMGLFTLVMSIYGFAVTLATSSVNLAAVRLTAERCARIAGADAVSYRKTIRQVIGSVCRYSLLFGCGAAVLLLGFSRPIAQLLLDDMRTLSSLRVLAFGLPAISLTSALNGYFTGMRKIVKNAVMILWEQAAKFCITATALVCVVPTGSVEYMCLAVVGGSAAAEAFSLLAAVILYLTDSRIPKGDTPGTDSRFLPTGFQDAAGIAFPVAVGAYARQGLVTAEHLAIPWGLRQSGSSQEEALAAYGVLQGMALQVVLFPYAVIGAFTGMLIPEVTALDAVGEQEKLRKLCGKVLRTAAVFSLVSFAVFFLFADSLGNGIYHTPEAGEYIRKLAFLVPFMYMDTVTDALLKGLGEQRYCMKVNIADALISLVLVVLLTPPLGLGGYIVSMYACEIINLYLSAHKLYMRICRGEKTAVKISPNPQREQG